MWLDKGSSGQKDSEPMTDWGCEGLREGRATGARLGQRSSLLI